MSEHEWQTRNAQTEVAAWISECDEPVRIAQIRAAFGDVKNINSTLSRLANLGLVRRVGKGLYTGPSSNGHAKPEGPKHPNVGEVRAYLKQGVELGVLGEVEAALLFWEFMQ